LTQQIILRYYRPGYNIAISNWNQVWWLTGEKPIQLKPEYYRGPLVYRLPGSSKRITYKKIKAGLLHKQTIVEQEIFMMPF
jgi:hypothetical protein